MDIENPKIVQIVAELAFGADVEITDAKIKDFSAHQVGFVGVHESLEISGKSESKGHQVKTKRFFVKRLPHHEYHDKLLPLHRQELRFYSQLMPELKKCDRFDKFAPDLIYGSESTIILEDAREFGFEAYYTRSLGAAKLQAVAKALARLHAYSLLARAKSGKSIDALFSVASNQYLFATMERRGTDKLLVELCQHIAEEKNLVCRGLRAGFESARDYILEKKGKGLVMCHGDVWANNLMFDRSESPNCLLIDFQLAGCADQIADLLQLMYVSCDRVTRENCESSVLETYYRTFSGIVLANDPGWQIRSLEELKRDYEDNRMIGMVYALIYYPIIVLGQEILTQDLEPQQYLSKIMMRQTNDVIIDLFAKYPDYKARIAEAAEQFVEFCQGKYSNDSLQEDSN